MGYTSGRKLRICQPHHRWAKVSFTIRWAEAMRISLGIQDSFHQVPGEVWPDPKRMLTHSLPACPLVCPSEEQQWVRRDWTAYTTVMTWTHGCTIYNHNGSLEGFLPSQPSPSTGKQFASCKNQDISKKRNFSLSVQSSKEGSAADGLSSATSDNGK